MRTIFLAVALSLVGGCQLAKQSVWSGDPHSKYWSLGFAEPNFMPVWVEDSAALDVEGRLFRRLGSGLAAGGEPAGDGEHAKGWAGVGGMGNAVVGAKLPKVIYVRWQSIAEQKTFEAWVDVPEEARVVMRRAVAIRCAETPDTPGPYDALVSLGLAPGGAVQMWAWDECNQPIAVARAKASLVPLGPYQGLSDGHYYPQSEASKRYIERYGIPYGSW